jgi:hypothetical protein
MHFPLDMSNIRRTTSVGMRQTRLLRHAVDRESDATGSSSLVRSARAQAMPPSSGSEERSHACDASLAGDQSGGFPIVAYSRITRIRLIGDHRIPPTPGCIRSRVRLIDCAGQSVDPNGDRDGTRRRRCHQTCSNSDEAPRMRMVVARRQMHTDQFVPYDEIAWRPVVPVHEVRSHDMAVQKAK